MPGLNTATTSKRIDPEMRLTASIERDHRLFIIEEDPAVGFYLYVYQQSECVADHLQDTLEMAIEQAEEDYGVPRAAWVTDASKS